MLLKCIMHPDLTLITTVSYFMVIICLIIVTDTEDEPTAAKKLADTDDSEMLYTVEQSIVQSLLFFYSEFLMN